MRKPNGYDDSEAIEGGFRSPQAGPCIMGVAKVTTQNNRNGEQQLLLFLDIAEGEFKNFYRRQGERFQNDKYLRFWQNTEGKSLPHFKGLIKSFEESNSRFVFNFDESMLVHKKIGANLREKEYVRSSDGTIGTYLKVAYLCSTRSVLEGKHKVLPVEKLSQQNDQQREPGIDDIPPEDYNQDINYGDEPIPF